MQIESTASAVWPAWIGWLLGAIGLTAIFLAWLVARAAPVRAWRRFAREIGGALTRRSAVSPSMLTASISGRPYAIRTAVSHDSDLGYYHTSGSMPVDNEAGFVLGLRRRSLLEEMLALRQPAPPGATDPDFGRRFVVVTNQPDALPSVLTQPVIAELSRYPDIELYVRLAETEWRRGGEVRGLASLRRLTDLLSSVASVVDAMPARQTGLEERLRDEATISRGV